MSVLSLLLCFFLLQSHEIDGASNNPVQRSIKKDYRLTSDKPRRQTGAANVDPGTVAWLSDAFERRPID